MERKAFIILYCELSVKDTLVLKLYETYNLTNQVQDLLLH